MLAVNVCVDVCRYHELGHTYGLPDIYGQPEWLDRGPGTDVVYTPRPSCIMNVYAQWYRQQSAPFRHVAIKIAVLLSTRPLAHGNTLRFWAFFFLVG